MTREDIIKLANEAELCQTIWIEEDCIELESVIQFAQLVAAAEREACAELCIEHGKVWAERFLLGFQATLDDAAEAIRARGTA